MKKEKKVKGNKYVRETYLLVPSGSIIFRLTVLNNATLWRDAFFVRPRLYVVPVRIVVHSAAFQL